ncbi:MAG TPA: DUF6731 family protein [Terriglobales bacterium]|nr:DUF6731 family protein [Terriglobales bacterium]
MATKLSYDFFIPSALTGADFSAALKKLLDTPMHQRRVDYGVFYFDVSDAEARNGQTVGLVSRHRMRNLPPTGDSRTGALDRLILSDHQSVAEPCAFLYDSELNIVVFQRSPHVSHTAFARLINWAADTSFVFLPVLNEDAMTRLEKLHKPRRFVLTVASPQAAQYFDDLKSSLKGLAPFLRELAGGRIRIEVGVLPKSHYLSKDAILHTVGALLDRLDDEHLEKLEVDGEDEAGNNHIVDFIDGQFRGHEAVAESAPRHTDIGLLKDSIGKAFDTSRVYLSTQLRSRATQPVERYQVQKKAATHIDWRFNNKISSMPEGKILRLRLPKAALVHWSIDGWATSHDTNTQDTEPGDYIVDLPTRNMTSGDEVCFTFYWLKENNWEGTDYKITVHPPRLPEAEALAPDFVPVLGWHNDSPVEEVGKR